MDRRRGRSARLGITGNEGLSRRLVDALADDDPKVRERAMNRLGDLGRASAAAIPTLVTWLDDDAAESRATAAGALGKFGAAATAALERLTTLAGEDPDEGTRLAAIHALAAIDGSAPAVLRTYTAALGDDDQAVRAAAIEHGLLLGDRAWIDGAMAVIETSPRPDDRRRTVHGLWQRWRRSNDENFRTAVLEPRIIAALRDADPAVARAAVDVIGAMKLVSSEIITALVSLLDHDDAAVRLAAVRALAPVGPSAQAAIPALLTLLDDPSPGMRDASAAALGAAGVGRADVAEAMIVRIEAGGDHPGRIPAPYWRRSAASGLRRIGSSPHSSRRWTIRTLPIAARRSWRSESSDPRSTA